MVDSNSISTDDIKSDCGPDEKFERFVEPMFENCLYELQTLYVVTCPDGAVQNAKDKPRCYDNKCILPELRANASDKAFQQILTVFVCLKVQNK